MSYQLGLDTLSRDQGYELYQRRVASVTDYEHDDHQEVPLDPFTYLALNEIHERSKGVPATMIIAISELIDQAVSRYERTGTTLIATGDAKKIEYDS